MLTLIRELPTMNHVRFGLFLCGECGRETEKRIANVKNGNTSSCGCKARSKKGRKFTKSKNQEQPWEPINSGTSQPPPLPVPSFERVSRSEFQVVNPYPMWAIVRGGKVIDRIPMNFTERRFYQGAKAR